MRRIIYLVCFCFCFQTCDDGDVFEITLDFDDTFRQCGGNSSLVLFKINTSTSETLSIQLPGETLDNFLAVDDNNMFEDTFPIGSTNVFNYRSYGTVPNRNFFCNDVPPSNLQIQTDEVSISGEVKIETLLTEDDNDGIPAEDEDLNNNGNLEDDDTDNDGIPNYLDEDDDGDNVLTINELDTENIDGDDNPLTNPLNTDANSSLNPDMIPDYLDSDDDGDGVLTRDEENIEQDENPSNDVPIDMTLNPNALPNYLNDQIATALPAVAYRTHNISQTYTVRAIVSNITLPSFTQETLDFGTLDNSGETPDLINTNRQVTPNLD